MSRRGWRGVDGRRCELGKVGRRLVGDGNWKSDDNTYRRLMRIVGWFSDTIVGWCQRTVQVNHEHRRMTVHVGHVEWHDESCRLRRMNGSLRLLKIIS